MPDAQGENHPKVTERRRMNASRTIGCGRLRFSAKSYRRYVASDLINCRLPELLKLRYRFRASRVDARIR